MKQEIMLDELIRENARLLVQQEADRLRIEDLTAQIEELSANVESLEAHSYAREGADDYETVTATLNKAIADLIFVMAGGDPCKVCTVKCLMGEGNCKPVWRGLA